MPESENIQLTLILVYRRVKTVRADTSLPSYGIRQRSSRRNRRRQDSVSLAAAVSCSRIDPDTQTVKMYFALIGHGFVCTEGWPNPWLMNVPPSMVCHAQRSSVRKCLLCRRDHFPRGEKLRRKSSPSPPPRARAQNASQGENKCKSELAKWRISLRLLSEIDPISHLIYLLLNVGTGGRLIYLRDPAASTAAAPAPGPNFSIVISFSR